MALKTPYLAAENSAMDRRSRGIHRFLVASPILLLLAVGLVGHIKKPPHLGAAGSPEYDRKVLLYRERVASAQGVLRRDKVPTVEQLEAEALAWSEGFRSKTLPALKPAFYEDHLREGVRGEVLRAGIGIGALLSVQANENLKAGDYAAATRRALLTAETAFGLRDFELQAHLQTLIVARRAIQVVAGAWPFLSEAERDAYRPRLRALIADPAETESLSKLDEMQFNDYKRRQQIQQDKPEDVENEKSSSGQVLKAAKRSTLLLNQHVQNLIDYAKP